MNGRAWRVTLAAAVLMALLAGARSVFGPFASPANAGSGLGLAMAARPMPAASSTAGRLASAAVEISGLGASSGFDGVVEAVRQSVVAAQVTVQ